MAKKKKVDKTFKTIKQMIFNLFEKNGLENLDLDDIVKKAQAIKKDTKFDKYHLSYWKSKYKSFQLENKKPATKQKQVKKTSVKVT